jgi:hypothetical protein
MLPWYQFPQDEVTRDVKRRRISSGRRRGRGRGRGRGGGGGVARRNNKTEI